MEEPRQPRRGPRLDKVGRGWWIGLAVVGTTLLIIALWLYVRPDTATEKKDFIQAVGILIAGLAGFLGLYFTWTNLEQTRRTTQRTLELTEQGQITERFTRAIDQLGATDDERNARLEVRLGGIYALERIDKESPERAYHSTVMEVLTAYIRENAPWASKPEIPKWISEPSKSEPAIFTKENAVSDSASNEPGEQERTTDEDTEPTLQTLPTDIQAILDVINRREEDAVPEKHRLQSLDLRVTDLRGANLYETNLEGANLLSANLEGGQLSEANLKRANLVNARLKEATGLTSEQIEWTIGHEKTKIPEYLVDDRPVMWTKSIEEQRKTIEVRLKQEPEDE